MIKNTVGIITKPNIVRNLPAEVKPQPTTDDVRSAVVSLANAATASVKIVRDAFAAGVAPYQTAGSGSVASYIAGFSSTAVGSKIIRSTSHMGLSTSTAGSSVLPPRPEIDNVEVIERREGMLDQFAVKLTLSIHQDNLTAISSIRIMRAKLGPIKAQRPSFSALMFAPSAPGMGLDRIATSAFRVDGIGVGNKLTTFIADSKSSLNRAVTSPDAQTIRQPLASYNTNRGESESGLLKIDGADRSVIENLTFYLNRRSLNSVDIPSSAATVSVGDSVGMNVIKGSSVAAANDILVQDANPMNFTEIARIDMGGPSIRSVGDFLETSFVDGSVVYGAGFVYYASCIGVDGAEGPRSKLINANVLRNIPPSSPHVSYAIIGGHPRFAIRCEQGIDHVEVFRSGRSVSDSIRLGSDSSLIVQGPATKIGNFWHIIDSGVGPDGSTTFVDTGAVSGDKLSYRFYSVDPYGMKCQTPFSCSIKMPDHGHSVPMSVPTITVDQISGQIGISVKVSIDDAHVAGFTVQRREISINELSAHQANQPQFVDIGTSVDSKRAGSRRGPTMLDATWPSYIPAISGSAAFTDSSVRLDRVYQYAVGAIDVRGNKTPLIGSNLIGVYAKTVIDAPVAFAADVKVKSGLPTGVLLTWSGGTSDFSPNAIVGDQDVLAATSVRSVYQVERRHVGVSFWDALPATSESYFFDKISDDKAPSFRPAYAAMSEQYEYRVLAMQSGGFVSQRSDTVSVSTVATPSAPDTVWARSTPLVTNPMSIIVSWNMRNDFIERWEIERASTNKIYGAQITSMDSRLAAELKYTKVASITPESSRARGMSADKVELDKTVHVGNRFYVDSDVSRANSYFYRVRSVGTSGHSSEWRYAGISLKDAAFDRKFYSTVSDDKKIALSADVRPIAKRTPK